MRQRITHGATIDTATPSEVADLIAGAFDRQFEQEYWREKGAIPLDVSGNGQQALQKVSSQYDWLMERITITGANALVTIYENSPGSGADLLEVVQVGAAGLYSDSFSNNLYVPANSQIVIVVANGTPNTNITFNFQIRLKKR